MIRWYDDIRLDQHSIHMCPRIPYRMSHRCILIQQKYIVLYREFLFTCMLCFPYAWVYKVSIRNNKTKTNQLLRCITYGFLFILNDLKIVYILILCLHTSKHILKSLRQYSYFYFDYANISWHVIPWLIFFHIRFWSLILSILYQLYEMTSFKVKLFFNLQSFWICS